MNQPAALLAVPVGLRHKAEMMHQCCCFLHTRNIFFLG